MGLLGAIGSGLAEAGYAGAKIGMEQIRAAIEADRDARLNEMKMAQDQVMRDRNRSDAATERGRVAEFSKPIVAQKDAATGLIAANAGLNDAETIGADENVGVDVQKASRAPLPREMQQRANAAGDLVSATKFSTDANLVEDNARLDKREVKDEAKQKSDDEKWRTTTAETIRHNKALEQAALAKTGAEKLSPAAKVQLEIASVGVKSAQIAEAEAAKALNEAAKLGEPEAIKAAKADYASAKSAVAASLENYNKTGQAHLDGWKTIEPTTSASPGVGAPPPLADRVVGKAYPTPKGDMEWTGSGWKPATAAKPAAAQPEPARPKVQASADPEIVSLEPAGKSLIGGKQFVAKYADGTTKLISGADAERKAILMSK